MKILNVRIPDELHEQLKTLSKVEKKTLTKTITEGLINHLGNKEFLNKLDVNEIYKFILMEYINRTRLILEDVEREKPGDSFDLKYLQFIQKKYFEARICVYENILKTLEKGEAPKSITEIVDFSHDDDFSLIGKIAAAKEIKFELHRLLNVLKI